MKKVIASIILLLIIALVYGQVKINRKVVKNITTTSTTTVNNYGIDFPITGLTLENVFYIPTGAKIWRGAVRPVFPHSMYYKGTHERYYFVVFGNTTTGLSRATNYVFYYDFDTKEFSPLYTAIEAAVTNDVHGLAALWVENDGTIIVAADTMDAANHNQGIIVRYSTNPEDPSAWSMANPSIMKKSDGTVAKGTYPNFFRVKNNPDSLFMLFRYPDSPRNQNVITVSTDKGRTWSPVKVITTLTAPNWAYPSIFLAEDSSKVGYVIRFKDDSKGYITKTYYVESTNGRVWSNIQGTFSKDIFASGELTQTDLDNNCLVFQHDGSASYDFEEAWSGSFDKNGYPVLIGRYRSTGNYSSAPVSVSARDAYVVVVYWDGSAWRKHVWFETYDSYGYTSWADVVYAFGGGTLGLMTRMHYPGLGQDSIRFLWLTSADYGSTFTSLYEYPLSPSTRWQAGLTGDVVGRTFSPSSSNYVMFWALSTPAGQAFDTGYDITVFMFRKLKRN